MLSRRTVVLGGLGRHDGRRLGSGDRVGTRWEWRWRWAWHGLRLCWDGAALGDFSPSAALPFRHCRDHDDTSSRATAHQALGGPQGAPRGWWALQPTTVHAYTHSHSPPSHGITASHNNNASLAAMTKPRCKVLLLPYMTPPWRHG